MPADLEEFLRAPASAAVITDFDGTLSPIVEDPRAAMPLPGAVDTLHALAARYGRVAVVSGRPVEFLRDRLELESRPRTSLVLSGLYGLQRLVDGEIYVHPQALEWRAVVDETAGRAEAAAPEAVGVERKGLSVALHVRNSPQMASWAHSWAEATAATTGLVLHLGRMSFELRPPVHVDKGSVVSALVEGCSAACFLGDDAGDLPAFDALDRLAAGSDACVVLKVGVRSSEAPIELIERAGVLVDGPAGALELLRALLDQPRAASS